MTLIVTGCDRPAAPPPSTKKSPTIASLVPAATDLLVGMGAADHLVAVSNYCPPRAETAGLPKVGDYRTIDWERLAELRPAVMVTQFRPDKMPDGLEEKARSYGIRLVNVRINRLDDVFAALEQLGVAANEPAKAAAAAARIRGELDAVRARVAGRPPVRVYVGRTGNPLEAVGGGNFLDDLLTVAGGRNVLAGPGYDDNAYPAIDRERLLGLNPDAALNLLPGASPQVLDQARTFWSTTPTVSAVRAGRVHYLTDDDLLLPGANVGRTAMRFAELLHPAGAGTGATTGPATRAARDEPSKRVARACTHARGGREDGEPPKMSTTVAPFRHPERSEGPLVPLARPTTVQSHLAWKDGTHSGPQSSKTSRPARGGREVLRCAQDDRGGVAADNVPASASATGMSTCPCRPELTLPAVPA